MNTKIPEKEIHKISSMEWEKIIGESKSAEALLSSEKFSFFRDYIKNSKNSLIMLVATNSVKDLVETQTGQDGYSKSIKTTKEEQLHEIAGCLKFIDKFMGDLLEISKQEERYLEMEKNKRVIIELSKEDATEQ